MKRIIFSLLMPLFVGIAFIGCSVADDSYRINPEIVGYGILQEKDSVFYVKIDSVYYAVTSVTIGGFPSSTTQRTENIQRFVGEDITCFRAKAWQNPQFVVGKMDAKQVEFLYHKEPTSFWAIAAVAVLLFFIFLVTPKDNTKPAVPD